MLDYAKPTSPTRYGDYVVVAQTQISCQDRGRFPEFVTPPDLPNLFIRGSFQQRAGRIAREPPSSLCVPVRTVISLGTRKQMVWVDTASHITSVQDAEPFWNGSIVNDVRKDVGIDSDAIVIPPARDHFEHAVAICGWPSPQPTCGGPLHVEVKPFARRQRVGISPREGGTAVITILAASKTGGSLHLRYESSSTKLANECYSLLSQGEFSCPRMSYG